MLLDLNSFVTSMNNTKMFAPSSQLLIQMTLVNASLPRTQYKDFRYIYAFNYKYQQNTSYVPPPPVNTTQEFLVSLNVGRTPIGLDAYNGKSFNYTLSVKNIMFPGQPASGPVNVVIGAPSCLALDTTFAQGLIASGAIVGYEVYDNGLTVLLLRSFLPGETRVFNV